VTQFSVSTPPEFTLTISLAIRRRSRLRTD
jgi:hypothetical protein